MGTPSEIFGAINDALAADPSVVAGVDAVYQFDLSGEQGGRFHVVARDGGGVAGSGSVDNPTTTFSMSASDFIDLTSGRLDPTMAYMSGKLRIRGDYGAALKLQALISAVRQ